jgi:CRP/FNR family transcriptional regulator, cyclic AMP receptor protein
MEATQRLGPRDARLAAAVRTCPLLGELEQQDLLALLSDSATITRARGQLLLSARRDAVAILLEGAAKEHRSTVDGQDVVLRLLGPGDVAGLTVSLGTPSGGDVTALEHTEVLLIPGSDLRTLARDRPGIAMAWLQAATQQLSELRSQTTEFALATAGERVVARLAELVDRWGTDVGGELRIPVRLTQDELASWAGTSRESTAKALKELRREGIVATSRRTITILDVDALQRRREAQTTIRLPDTLPDVD